MATVTGDGEGAPLAIGTVIGGAFGVMTGNPLTVFGVAFLFGALPQQVIAYLAAIDAGDDANAAIGVLALQVVSVAAFVLFSALSQSALVRASSAYLDGRAAGIGECVAAGIAKVLPVLGASILMVLGIVLGFVLLVVPGIILFVMWAVTIPALIEEDLGVTEAFGRSRALTKGSRWRVWFLMIVVAVISWIFTSLAAVPGYIAGVTDTAGSATSPLGIVVSTIVATLTTALWSTTVTALYFALRERREGLRSDRLADVFA